VMSLNTQISSASKMQLRASCEDGTELLLKKLLHLVRVSDSKI
jgi:hypothetical protein